MREIKFRAWSKDENKMYVNVPSQIMEFKGNIFKPHSFWGNDDIEIHAIPMQYTGLKDKNGIEIYEGDIMKAKRHNFEDYDICVIVYRPISFVFEVQSEKGNYIAPRNWHQHFEVIGNIYENSELLK